MSMPHVAFKGTEEGGRVGGREGEKDLGGHMSFLVLETVTSSDFDDLHKLGDLSEAQRCRLNRSQRRS